MALGNETMGLEDLRQIEQGDEQILLESTEQNDDSLYIPMDAVVQLVSRIDDLEQVVEQLKTKQQIDSEEFREAINELKHKQSSMNTETRILQSRSDHISEFVDELESRLDRLGDSVQAKHQEIDRRITLLEEGNTADRDDEIVNSAGGIENHRLSRLSRLDNETIEEEFSVDIRRAIDIYRNFEEWSSKTTAGRRIKSGELRKLLNAKTSESLAWTQVYRAMDAFESNTTDDYELIETKTIGKALIQRA